MTRPPLGARIALLVAALGTGAILADPKGNGRDPLLRNSTKMIGAGGLIWMIWAALTAGFKRGA